MTRLRFIYSLFFFSVITCTVRGQSNRCLDIINDSQSNFYVIIEYGMDNDTKIQKRCVLFRDLCIAMMLERKAFVVSYFVEFRNNIDLQNNLFYQFSRRKSIKHLDGSGISFEEVNLFRNSEEFKNVIRNKIELLDELYSKSNVSSLDAIYFAENGILHKDSLIIFYDNWNMRLALLAGVMFTDGIKATLRHGPELVVNITDFYKTYKGKVND
jgi:hypothetical protein